MSETGQSVRWVPFVSFPLCPHVPTTEPTSDNDWTVIKPMLPNKPRGVHRMNERRVLNGIFWSCDLGRPGSICLWSVHQLLQQLCSLATSRRLGHDHDS